MDTLGDIISKKNPNSVLMKGIKASLVVEYVEKLLVEIFGQAIYGEVQVLHLKKQIITIACLNPAVANEIKFKQQKIIDQTNEEFGKETVLRLKIML